MICWTGKDMSKFMESMYIYGVFYYYMIHMSKEDIQILLETAAVLIGLYLAFFKSYFQEKGKNLATKEDITEITEKIEKVKSDIGILTHKKISLSTEKQNSLMELISKYSAWLNYIMYV